MSNVEGHVTSFVGHRRFLFFGPPLFSQSRTLNYDENIRAHKAPEITSNNGRLKAAPAPANAKKLPASVSVSLGLGLL